MTTGTLNVSLVIPGLAAETSVGLARVTAPRNSAGTITQIGRRRLLSKFTAIAKHSPCTEKGAGSTPAPQPCSPSGDSVRDASVSLGNRGELPGVLLGLTLGALAGLVRRILIGMECPGAGTVARSRRCRAAAVGAGATRVGGGRGGARGRGVAHDVSAGQAAGEQADRRQGGGPPPAQAGESRTPRRVRLRGRLTRVLVHDDVSFVVSVFQVVQK